MAKWHLGCDFFTLISKYANTQKTIRHRTAKVLPKNDALAYPFCKTGVFVALICRYALQNDHFYLCICVFVFVARIEGTFFVSFWNTSKCADAKKDAK
jgi:hypothetical protein